MAIKWGSTYVTAVKWGNTTCTKVYWGGTLVFPNGGWDGSGWSYPLTNGFTYSLTGHNSIKIDRRDAIVSDFSKTVSIPYNSGFSSVVTAEFVSKNTFEWKNFTGINITWTLTTSANTNTQGWVENNFSGSGNRTTSGGSTSVYTYSISTTSGANHAWNTNISGYPSYKASLTLRFGFRPAQSYVAGTVSYTYNLSKIIFYI